MADTATYTPTPAPGSAGIDQLSQADQDELAIESPQIALDMAKYNAAVAACEQQKAKAEAAVDSAANDVKNDKQAIESTQQKLDETNDAIEDEESKDNPDAGKIQELKQQSKDLRKEEANENARLNKDKKKETRLKKRLNQIAKKKCKLPTPTYCVPADKSKNIPDPFVPEADALNAEKGTKIDFTQLVTQEGSTSAAYVPWSAVDLDSGQYVTKWDKDTVDGAESTILRGAKVNGKGNKSGVSIGTGVDLGQQKKVPFYKGLDKYNAKYHILDPDDLQKLKNEIDPYMGLKRSLACRLLRKQPLSLTKDEIKLLNAWAANEFIDKLTQDPNFVNLTAQQQTNQFKAVYNTGH